MEFQEIIAREYLEQDDIPGSGIKQKRVVISPFKRRFIGRKVISVFSQDVANNPRKNIFQINHFIPVISAHEKLSE